MARVPLLDDDASPSRAHTLASRVSWTHRLLSQLSGQDEMTFAICKATAPNGPMPKDKYVSYLIGLTDRDPNILEEMLLRFSALTEWSEDKIVSCKTLVVVHQILQRLDRYYNKNQSAVIFLTEIKVRWQRQDAFLEGYAIALLHRILMDLEQPALATAVYGQLSAIAINSTAVLRGYGSSDILLFLSNMISYLARLSALGTSDMSNLSTAEREAFSYASSLVATECRAQLTVAGHILNHLRSLNDVDAQGALGPLEAQLEGLRNTWRVGSSTKSSSWI